MKITQKTLTESGLADLDYRNYLAIEVNGEEKVSFLDGEPEDANLNRDFNDCWSIVSLMKLAYDAGKAGESLDIEQIEVDDPE